MDRSSRAWLAVGTPQNWHTAFDFNGIWGLKASQRNHWEAISENEDLVFFYATSPVSGVVGYGVVRTKLFQHSLLWPDERARNEVIWPLRFEFDVISCLPPASWERSRVGKDELRPRVRIGFQPLSPELAQRFLGELPAAVPQGLVLAEPIGPRSGLARPIAPAIPTGLTLHDQAKLLIAEIGRMQKFVSDVEFPIENRRIDVVWRRVARSVPSHVFEVQVSGNLTEALGKLKQAFDLWNSNLFLVGNDEHRSGVSQLTAGTFREIGQRVKFLEHRQIGELYQRKRDYMDMETGLGILAP